MSLSFLRYIGVRDSELTVEREGLDIVHTAVVSRGTHGVTDCSAKLASIGVCTRTRSEGVDELLAMELIAICPLGKAML